MDPELVHHTDAMKRFVDEARITGQLDHPNIVPIYDFAHEAATTPEFMMKLVEGETLAARLKKLKQRPDVDLARLLEIFLKVCDAVAFAHSRGVIHRDLKPSNIMIGEFGQVYVMDWGCAIVGPAPREKAPAEARPRKTIVDPPGTVIGTFAYMAPEQALGKGDEIDQRTDVFGLGAVLYQVLTGIPPYPGPTDTEAMKQAQAGSPRPPHEVALGRTPPIALSQIAMRALAKERADRFPTVTALRDEVEKFLHRGAFFTSRPFPAGTLIVREGELADEAYVITSGRCEAFREERGRRISLRTLGPGDVFGEAVMFAREPRNASIVAVDDVSAIVVTREVLERELGIDSWMGTFIRALTARYRDLESRHTLTRRVTDNARIATAIISHISRAGTWVRPGVLGTSWARLWDALGDECGIDEDAALSIVARTTSLAVDGDEITLELLSMA
jgi:serine/threonine-protein kinase